MQILSFHTRGKWVATNSNKSIAENEKPERDTAKDEISRVLSDCFRCSNLVVLTGLGTSLHVNIDKGVADYPQRRVAITGKKIAPTMRDLWVKAKEASGDNFETITKLSKFPVADENFKENIEALLSYCKIGSEFTDLEKHKTLIADFIKNTEEIIRDEVSFLSEEDSVAVHTELLRRIARRSSRKVRAKIFTTNYDLCFEYAARQGRYVVIDGFSHTSPQVFDSIYFSYDIVKRDGSPDTHDFISNVFHLYKLHGSVDWTKNAKTNEIERAPGTKNPVLVYPRNTKYELAFEHPYLEMMSAFQAAIRQPETALLIVGFGFNDNHIAEPILSAIHSNLNLKVVVCDPRLAPNEELKSTGAAAINAHISKIRYLIENGDARLSLINGTFEELVPELPDIAAETDLEKHMERVRLLRGQEHGH